MVKAGMTMAVGHGRPQARAQSSIRSPQVANRRQSSTSFILGFVVRQRLRLLGINVSTLLASTRQPPDANPAPIHSPCGPVFNGSERTSIPTVPKRATAPAPAAHFPFGIIQTSLLAISLRQEESARKGLAGDREHRLIFDDSNGRPGQPHLRLPHPGSLLIALPALIIPAPRRQRTFADITLLGSSVCTATSSWNAATLRPCLRRGDRIRPDLTRSRAMDPHDFMAIGDQSGPPY